MAANLIVMPNVRIIHNQIVAAQSSDAPALSRPAIHTTKLAKYILVADLKRNALPRKSTVLRIPANHRKRINAIPAPQPPRPLHHSVMLQHATIAQLHIIADDSISPNAHPSPKPRSRRNNRV